MKNKEKILRKNYSYMGRASTYSHNQIYNAMDEFSKEVAIDYSKWIIENGFDFIAGDNTRWIKFESQTVINSSEELFELYKKEKQLT